MGPWTPKGPQEERQRPFQTRGSCAPPHQEAKGAPGTMCKKPIPTDSRKAAGRDGWRRPSIRVEQTPRGPARGTIAAACERHAAHAPICFAVASPSRSSKGGCTDSDSLAPRLSPRLTSNARLNWK